MVMEEVEHQNKEKCLLVEKITIDGYISKYGGIESQVDGRVYTTKGGYLDHLKANNCHIKDY